MLWARDGPRDVELGWAESSLKIANATSRAAAALGVQSRWPWSSELGFLETPMRTGGKKGARLSHFLPGAAFLSGLEEWREKGGREGEERVEERGRKKTVGWERKGRREERGETGGVESSKGGGG